ncbi:MAG: hypothetical protein K2L01_07465 [Rikenellaceae bacterium]|nr:hypothetical protein [Rikenellaceae bacterium]
MEKQILLPMKVKQEMMRTFGVGRKVLGTALKYQNDSTNAKMLRAAALQRGGVVYTGESAPAGFVPKIKTSTTGEIMTQLLGERIVLCINKKLNRVRLFINNEEVLVEENMTIRHWGDMLYSLRSLYEKLNA